MSLRGLLCALTMCRAGLRQLSLPSVVGMTALAGCVTPAAERVERDAAVGRAESGSNRVHVRGGLAVVRDFSRERLVLWANAPSLRVDLEVDGTQPLELRVSNCMPDAELSPSTREVEVMPLASGRPTECRWELRPHSSRFHIALRSSRDSLGSFEFAVLSDIQDAIDDVQDIYRLINAEPSLAFVLGVGDLTSQGTEEELQRFEEELGGLHVPYYATLGNHELGVSPPLFHDYFGRGSAHFVFGGVHFTFLDSASATIDPAVYEWLDGWLEAGEASPHVVATHIPPIDPVGVRNGSFASRAEAAKLLGRLADGGVDLTLYGHIHSYYRFQNAGIPAHISGGGGAIPETFDGIGRHFMVVTMDGDRGVLGTRTVAVD